MNRYSTILLAVVLSTVALVALAQNPAPQQPAAAPQAAPANPLSTEAKQMYNGVKTNLIKMAEKMPEEHYAFKATPDVRTFGQLVGHVADSQARTCGMLIGDTKQLGASSKTSKADLVAALKESFTMCDKAFDSLTSDAKAVELFQMGQRQSTRVGALVRTVSHSNEEYGYMSVYMRLKGIVPPSSEPR